MIMIDIDENLCLRNYFHLVYDSKVLQDAFHRCIMSLYRDSKENDVNVQIMFHVVRCYSVAAQFEDCREKITEIPDIVKDICTILYFQVFA